MKIHIFINCYWGKGISGGDRRILELLKRWQYDSRYKIILYTSHDFEINLKKEGINRVEVNYVDKENCVNKGIIITYFARTFHCIKLLKSNLDKEDILYSPTDIIPDVFPPLIVKKLIAKNNKWCMVTHHIYEKFYKRPGNALKNFLSCMQQKVCLLLGKYFADVILTVSPVVQEYLRLNGFNMSKVYVMGNAVDVNKIEEADMMCSSFDACFLARLNYSKGIFELPEIWKKVVKKYPNAKLGIMGKGTDDIVSKMKTQIAELHLENNIQMLGYVSENEAYSVMKKSKMFLFTSHEEGWGIAVAEALVCGIPVVAYDLPIYQYIFKNGVITGKLKNIEEMADKVCYLMEHEDIRVKIANNGKRFVIDNYSWDKLADSEMDKLLKMKSEVI